MEYMFTWFLSGVILILVSIPFIMDASSTTDGKKIVEPRYAFAWLVVWGFIGALFIRGYDNAFWYLSSVFVMSSLVSLYKTKSHDDLPTSTMPFTIWLIIGLIIPFITGM